MTFLYILRMPFEQNKSFFTKPLILEGNLLAMSANKVFAFEANNDYNCFTL
jgi:hypothetical protein